MKKKFVCLLLCGVLTLSATPVSAAAPLQNSNVTFTIDGMKPISDVTAINSDGKNYLPMRVIFEMMGGKVDWNNDKHTARVTIDDTQIVINADDMTATINGEKADIGAKKVAGQLYIPVRLMGETLGYKVNWNQETRTINIITLSEDKEYIMLDYKPEITEKTRVITFDEAKKMVIDKSTNLKTIDESKDYLDEVRDNLGMSLNSIESSRGMIEGALLNPSVAADDALALEMSLQESISSIVSIARSIKNVDVQSSLTKVNEQMVKDGLEIALISQLNTLKATEYNINLLEQSLTLGAEDLENTRLKNSLGYASDVDLKKAELKQKETEQNLAMLKESLVTQKESLNITLGIDAKEDVYVDYNVEVKELEDFKLEPFIMKQRESAPSIKTLEGQVTIAEYTRRTAPSILSEPVIGATNDLNTAKRNLKDGKDSLEKNIRSAYHNIQQLILNDKQLKLEVEQAIIDYNSVVTSYKAGMATEFQVRQAKLGILSAEKNVEDNKQNYAMLLATFEKPYLLQ